MVTRNLSKMSAEIKRYLHDSIKNLITESDINSLKNFNEEQSGLVKDLTAKISPLDEKLNGSRASIDKIKIKSTTWKESYHTSSPETNWNQRRSGAVRAPRISKTHCNRNEREGI